MNILIASASPDDARYFPAALGGHRVETIDGVPAGGHEDAEAIAVVHGQPASREALDAMPCLRLIVTRSTGYDHIDLAEAKRRDIAVCNVPEYGSTTVAEFTMGLILSLARKIPQAVAESRKGAFSVEGLTGIDLAGKTLGIVGFGSIGRKLARMAKGFDMRIGGCAAAIAAGWKARSTWRAATWSAAPDTEANSSRAAALTGF